jgi:hypothetical protein
MKSNNSFISSLGNFFGQILKGIIAGLPGRKLVFKPNSKSMVQEKPEHLKMDSEKHYHRSKAKPAVEKQTLLKEKKKNKQ